MKNFNYKNYFLMLFKHLFVLSVALSSVYFAYQNREIHSINSDSVYLDVLVLEEMGNYVKVSDLDAKAFSMKIEKLSRDSSERDKLVETYRKQGKFKDVAITKNFKGFYEPEYASPFSFPLFIFLTPLLLGFMLSFSSRDTLKSRIYKTTHNIGSIANLMAMFWILVSFLMFVSPREVEYYLPETQKIDSPFWERAHTSLESLGQY